MISLSNASIAFAQWLQDVERPVVYFVVAPSPRPGSQPMKALDSDQMRTFS